MRPAPVRKCPASQRSATVSTPRFSAVCVNSQIVSAIPGYSHLFPDIRWCLCFFASAQSSNPRLNFRFLCLLMFKQCDVRHSCVLSSVFFSSLRAHRTRLQVSRPFGTSLDALPFSAVSVNARIVSHILTYSRIPWPTTPANIRKPGPRWPNYPGCSTTHSTPMKPGNRYPPSRHSAPARRRPITVDNAQSRWITVDNATQNTAGKGSSP